MAKNNSQPGESPGETRAGEEAEAQAGAAGEAIKAAETRPVVLRHKTPYSKYRCAGLVLTQKAETCQVTEAQLEKLRSDPWVVIEKDSRSK
ncbi:MAG: hypothetical protein LBK62_09490 [Treponema sp.]|jgi:hypothetical protein|nr:hypothetical protein [Treponema sp.]